VSGPADDPNVIVTATSSELQRFAAAHATDDDVFGDRIVLVRVHDAGASAALDQAQCYSAK
jgi:hypothetical protein